MEWKPIISLCKINPKSVVGSKKAELMQQGDFPFFTSGSKIYYVNSYMIDGENIYINDGGVAGFRYYCGCAAYADHVISIKPTNVISKFMYYCLDAKTKFINNTFFRGTGIKNITRKDFFEMKVPVPPLPVQEEIVRILDKFTELEEELEEELELRKLQYEWYREQSLVFSRDGNNDVLPYIHKLLDEHCPNGVEWKPLWSVTAWDKKFNAVQQEQQKIVTSFKHVSAKELKSLACGGNVKLLSTGNFDGFTSRDVAGDNVNEGEVIAIPSGGNANVKYYKGCFVDSGNLLATVLTGVNCRYLYYVLDSKQDVIENYYRGSGIKHPSMFEILQIMIPIPPLPVQEVIVSALDNFSAMVTNISSGLPAEITARRKQYEYYRDKLLPFEPMN